LVCWRSSAPDAFSTKRWKQSSTRERNVSPSIEAAYFNRQANFFIIIGALVCAMGAISMALSGNGLSLFSGVIFLVLGLGLRSAPLVAFGPSHVEIRPGVLTAKKLVRLSDIRAVRDNGKRLVLITNRGDITVPIDYLREGDRQLVRSRLSAQGS
jgi:hypothetical protein